MLVVTTSPLGFAEFKGSATRTPLPNLAMLLLSKHPRLTPVTISKASRHSLLWSSAPLLPLLLLLLLLLLLRPLYHPPDKISRFS